MWNETQLAVAEQERQRLQDYASELSEAERNWLQARDAAERIGWQVHLMGTWGDRSVRVYPPPSTGPSDPNG